MEDFNYTMDKMKRDGRNKTIYRCRSHYAQPKIIVGNGLEDLRRWENPDFSSPATIDLLEQGLGYTGSILYLFIYSFSSS